MSQKKSCKPVFTLVIWEANDSATISQLLEQFLQQTEGLMCKCLFILSLKFKQTKKAGFYALPLCLRQSNGYCWPKVKAW